MVPRSKGYSLRPGLDQQEGRQAEKKRLTLPSITANIQISAPLFRPDDGRRFANDGCHGNLA